MLAARALSTAAMILFVWVGVTLAAKMHSHREGMSWWRTVVYGVLAIVMFGMAMFAMYAAIAPRVLLH